MAAPTNPCYVKILLANSEPSTHGTQPMNVEPTLISALGWIPELRKKPGQGR
jgi:hypothetical protein